MRIADTIISFVKTLPLRLRVFISWFIRKIKVIPFVLSFLIPSFNRKQQVPTSSFASSEFATEADFFTRPKPLLHTRKFWFIVAGIVVVVIAEIIISRYIWGLFNQEPKLSNAPITSDYLYQSKSKDVSILLGNKKNKEVPKVKFSYLNSAIEMYSADTANPVTQVSKLNDQTLFYKSVFLDTDISYGVEPAGVKEKIIINTSHAAKNAYTFNFFLGNARPKMGLDRNFSNVFVDPVTGKYLFHFEKPYMVDAKGAKSDAVVMTIASKEYSKQTLLPTMYTVTLKPDMLWLEDPARAFPVVIDPTVTHNTQTAFATGTLNRVKDEGAADASPLLTSMYHELPADINTVGLWHMNEGSGTTTADSSGNSYTGTLSGSTLPSWNTAANSKLGNSSLSFNGSTAYVAVNSVNPFRSNFTVEVWVNFTAVNKGSDNVIIANGSAATDNGLHIVERSSKAYFGFYGDDCAGNTVFSTNTWYHLAYVYDGGKKIYVNGVLDNSCTSNAYASTATNTDIGLNPWSTAYFNGSLDEFRISNIARTPEEIKQDAQRFPYSVYTSPVIDLSNVMSWTNLTWTGKGINTGGGETPISTTNLVAQWNFNETSGTTAASGGSCGAACNGTLTTFSNTTGQDVLAGSGWTSTNARWGTGALMFNGSSNYVTASDTTLPSGASAQSIGGWFKTSASFATNTYEVFYFDGTKTTSQAIYFGVGNDANVPANNLFVGPHGYATVSNRPVNDGQWHYAVATFDGTTWYLYLDGALVSSKAMTTNIVKTGTVYIGNSNAANYWNGALDNVTVYNRTLTAPEILANYQAGNIEFQTRTSADNSTWEAWKPVTGETAITAMDSDATNWSADTTNPASGGITKSDDSTTKIEGTGSMKLQIGTPQSDANTVGLWHMDETSGTGAYIKDATANANNGTPTGTTVVDGFYGKARSFNGSSDLINFGNTPVFGTNDFSVSFWMNRSGTLSNTEFIIDRRTACSHENFWNITLGTNGTMNAEIDQDASGTNYGLITTTGNVIDGKWHYISLTRSGTAVKMYIDGVYNNGTTTTGTTNITGTQNLLVGSGPCVNKFGGKLDELKIDNVARTAEEIAEAYRAGRDHRLGRTITAADLSAKTKLPFYVAADRPGRYLEATIGNNAYVNYESDANTVGLWHLEEQTGSGAYIKDSSSNANNGTPTGTTFAQGKIGKGRSFNGTSDYINIPDNSSITPTGDYTLEAWVKTSSANTEQEVLTKFTASGNYPGYLLSLGSGGNTGKVCLWVGDLTGWSCGNTSVNDGNWHHIVGQLSGTTVNLYVDGKFDGSTTRSPNRANTTAASIGRRYDYASSAYFPGSIDEVRISNTARSAADIRAAFEIGRRTHPINIDFVTSPQAAYSSGTSVTINNPYGTTALTNTLSVGDTLIFKENVNGTETVGQATVTAITNTSTTYGTVTVASTPTFPSGGYSTNAKVFKWQREYFDLTSSLSTQRNGITRITLRDTDGSQGANVWLDDFRYNTNYINSQTPTSFDTATGVGTYTNTGITSTLNRYFQYRAILSSWDTPVSPQLTSAVLNYVSNNSPATPTISSPANGSTNALFTQTITLSTTDAESDYVRYYLQIATDNGFTQNVQTYDQTAAQTGWSGQNTQLNTAYTSGATATLTPSSDLTQNTTYYVRVKAIDPGGSGTFSAYSSIISFTTLQIQTPSNCSLTATTGSGNSFIASLTWTNNNSVITADNNLVEDSLNGGAYSQIKSVSGTATSDTETVADGTHIFRVRAAYRSQYSGYCTSGSQAFPPPSMQLQGVGLQGILIQ